MTRNTAVTDSLSLTVMSRSGSGISSVGSRVATAAKHHQLQVQLQQCQSVRVSATAIVTLRWVRRPTANKFSRRLRLRDRSSCSLTGDSRYVFSTLIYRVISLFGLVSRWDYRWVLNSDWDRKFKPKSEVIFFSFETKVWTAWSPSPKLI